MAPDSQTVPTVQCDAPESKGSAFSSAIKSVRTAVAVPESELKRWRRTFEKNAKAFNGEKCVDDSRDIYT